MPRDGFIKVVCPGSGDAVRFHDGFGIPCCQACEVSFPGPENEHEIPRHIMYAEPWEDVGCASSNQFPLAGTYEPIYFCELKAGHVGPHRALVGRPKASEVQWS